MSEALYNFLRNPSASMVFVSLISLFAYLFILLIIKIVFPKIKIPNFLILLGFSILPVISILRSGSYESGDINIHVARTISFYKSLSEGVIFPKWAGELNSTYGYALFNYFYLLPYYVSSLYHTLGLNFLASVKFFLASTYILSGLTMYFWLRKHFSQKSALLGSLFYLFAPYHLVDMHFRNAVGEMGAFVFIPLTFFCIDMIIEKGNFLWIFLCGINIALLFLSHPAVLIMESLLLAVYVFLRIPKKNFKNIAKPFLGIFLGIIYPSFNWIPVLLEAKLIHQRQNEIILTFPKISEILFSKFRFGLLFQGPSGEISTILGYAQWIVIFFSLYLIIFKKKTNYLFMAFTFFTLIYIFLIQNVSRPIWENVYFLKNMLMPYRFLVIIAFSTSVLAAFLINNIKSNFIFYPLIILVVGSTILNWGNRKNLPEINDKYLQENLPLINEGAWTAVTITRPYNLIWPFKIPDKHIEAIGGKLEIVSEKRITTKHSYTVNMETDGLVKENTYYFPNWKLFINGAEKNIVYDNKDYPGIITFKLDSGISRVDLIFKDSIIEKTAINITLFSLVLSGLYLIYEKIKK